MTFPTLAWAATDDKLSMGPLKIERHAVGPHDIHISIKYCGVCHSDLHIATNDLGSTIYPCVPGHEMVGVVDEVGAEVTKFAMGDTVGVGCFTDTCRECHECAAGEEQYCENGMTFTYNSETKYPRSGPLGKNTYGGYSSGITVDENYAIKIPSSIPMEKAGPLQCAAITMYDPLRHWDAGPGKRVGIAGLGGLGMMGLKLANAMKCDEVVAFTTSESKRDSALASGATKVCVTTSEDSVKEFASSCDLILNTVSATHELENYIPFLRKDGTLVQLGLVVQPHSLSQMNLLFSRKKVAGSVIGGIRSTQDCVNFCAENDILPDVKVVPVSEVKNIYDILTNKNDQVVRYVLDIENTMKTAHESG